MYAALQAVKRSRPLWLMGMKVPTYNSSAHEMEEGGWLRVRELPRSQSELSSKSS